MVAERVPLPLFVFTITVRSSLLANKLSLAVKRNVYTPARENVAVVFKAFAFTKATVPGPLTFDHVVVTVAGGAGSPSSLALPARMAPLGRVIVWSAPASTTGAWFVTPPPACETTKTCPAIVIVPTLAPLAELSATVKPTVSFPAPLPGAVIVIQLTLLVAVQVHPVEVTVAVPLPPGIPKF